MTDIKVCKAYRTADKCNECPFTGYCYMDDPTEQEYHKAQYEFKKKHPRIIAVEQRPRDMLLAVGEYYKVKEIPGRFQNGIISVCDEYGETAHAGYEMLDLNENYSESLIKILWID